MSCSSWTNSISVSGTASVSLSRRSVMISSADRSRSARGFSRTSTSPLFICVANMPSSEPVRRTYDATSGVLARIASTFVEPAFGFLERHARRREVVDDEAALVGRRAESRCRAACTRATARAGQQQRHEQRQDRPLQEHGQASRVQAIERAAAIFVVRPASAACARYAARASSGIRNSASTIEISTATDSVIDSALKKSPTTPESSPSGAKTTTVVSVDPTIGRDELAGGGFDRVGAAALGQAPMDVLDDDHGVVDDQADGDGHAAHRHQVDRLAEQPHEEERADDGQRQRAGGDEGQPPVAEEDQQHEHRERGADEDRVADVGDRGLDELREVVGLHELQPGGQARS